jgi:hypothetical protein
MQLPTVNNEVNHHNNITTILPSGETTEGPAPAQRTATTPTPGETLLRPTTLRVTIQTKTNKFVTKN